MSEPLGRGVVVRVRLDPAAGREIRKMRPAIVVSNRAACRFDGVVQIVPITGLPERQLRPYESAVGTSGTGLERSSRAVANQIRTVSKRRLGPVLGRVSEGEMASLERALMIQLGLA